MQQDIRAGYIISSELHLLANIVKQLNIGYYPY